MNTFKFTNNKLPKRARSAEQTLRTRDRRVFNNWLRKCRKYENQYLIAQSQYATSNIEMMALKETFSVKEQNASK